MTDETGKKADRPENLPPPAVLPAAGSSGPQSPEKTDDSGKSWLARNRGSAIVVGLAALAAGAISVAMAMHKKPAVPPAAVPPVNVEVMVVRARAEVLDTVDLPGVVEPNVVVKVAAEVPGRVESYGLFQQSSAPAATSPGGVAITKGQAATTQAAGCQQVSNVPGNGSSPPAPPRYLDEGDRIFAGQVLMRLNTDLLLAERDQVKANLELDQRDLESVEKLNQRGVSAKHELDQAKSKRNVSQALLDLVEARLKRATIVAPIGGVINRLPVEVGEYVQPGIIVAQIADMEKVKIVTDVPEKDAKCLHEGQEHLILLDLENDQSGDPEGRAALRGTITYLSSVGDSQTRTKRLELTVDNPTGGDGKRLLQSQQIVRVRLTRRVLTDAIMIPLMAVIPMQKEKDVFMDEVGIVERQASPSMIVYVNEGGIARQREIRIGILKGMSVSVVDGLKPDDRLIIAGHRQVAPGQKVAETAVRAPASRAASKPADTIGN
ncbi:MAG: efflux RND transporter periplasmic adaptor subunit [Planctomycetes bacterium]|nr:efflux RND transporter periplasmic adaptor subunit [Planctomycetota bacterium]